MKRGGANSDGAKIAKWFQNSAAEKELGIIILMKDAGIGRGCLG
jgi:hypothetical protein